MQPPFYVKTGIFAVWFYTWLFFLVASSPVLQRGIWAVVHDWWWLFLAVMFILPAWQVWKMYWELRFAKNIYDNLIFLRINLPQEIERSPKGMDNVFHTLHGITRSYIRWSDRVFYRIRQEWFSCEMVGMGGAFYFIVVCPKRRRSIIEAMLYSQYPDIEIEEIDDYTQSIPADAPNNEWKMWGVNYTLELEDFWMLKVYTAWDLDKEEEFTRKIDPIAQLGEFYSSLKAGEQVWIQIVCSPMVGGDWLDKGTALRRSIDRPTEKVDTLGEVQKGIEDFFKMIMGKEIEEERKETQRFRFPTQLDRKAIDTLGDKLSYPVYEINLRTIYWGAAEIFDRGRDSAINGFFKSFDDLTNNWIRMESRTRIRNRHFPQFFGSYRFQKKRKALLWLYRTRYLSGALGFRLNTTELASMFHFPGREVAPPGLTRLPFKKVQPPTELPVI